MQLRCILIYLEAIASNQVKFYSREVMTGYLNSVKQSKNYNNYKLTADKVVQSLASVREERTKSRRRWIWELMQNAKDVPNRFGGVTIEITLRDTHFIFSHNGDPFKVENITGLIQQVSSGKPSDSSNKRITGKFGTGFISTHLLSDVVTVRGIVEEDGLPPKQIEFELNRKSERSEELIGFIAQELDRIEKIEDEDLFPSKPNYHMERREDDCDTVFLYPLENQEAREAAIVGVEDLASTLPQTMFFLEELKKVVIKNEIVKDEVVYELFENFSDGNIYFPIIRKTVNGVSEYLSYIRHKDEELDLAVEVNNQKERVLSVSRRSPRLYRDFPLVGTENFFFPFILNGYYFFPTEKRDGVLLTDVSAGGALANRNIFVRSVEKCKEFVVWLEANGVKNLSLIAQSRVPLSLTEPEVIDWYRENVQVPYRSFLLERRIVEVSTGKLTLKQGIIPKCRGGVKENELFWDILNEYFGANKLCYKADLISWQENLGIDSELETWGHNVIYRLEDLLEEIQSRKIVGEIRLSGSDGSVVAWLNKVFNFLIDNGFEGYFKEYKIVPTIKGTLKSFNDGIYIERESKIPNEFIEIFRTLKGDDWYDIIIHREIIMLDAGHASKSVKDISEEINKVLSFEEKNQYGKVQSSFIDRVDADKILLEILRISASLDRETFQSRVFQLARLFFKSEAEAIVLGNVGEFNFYTSIRLVIKLLNSRIDRAGSLDNLGLNNSNVWLLEYLLLLQGSSEFKSLLERGNIFPNRKNRFCSVKDIYSYGTPENPLSDTLISLLKEMNQSEDWDEILINDDFRKLELPPKKIDELANKIQEELDKLGIDNSYSTRSGSILRLIRWCSDYPLDAQKYFGSFIGKKDKIFVNISLEDSVVGGNIVKLLSRKDRLEDLVAIVESNIDLGRLTELVEMSNAVGFDEVRKIVEELKEERDDFLFKQAIGQSVEQAFMDSLVSLSLAYEISYVGVGSQDIVVSNPANSRSYFIELKSISANSNNKSVKLAMSQAMRAVDLQYEGNYVVGILVRPGFSEQVSVDYVRSNLNVIFGIGLFLTDVIEKEKTFQILLDGNEEIKLAFEDTRRKVKVSEHFWRSQTKSFSELIERMTAYLG